MEKSIGILFDIYMIMHKMKSINLKTKPAKPLEAGKEELF